MTFEETTDKLLKGCRGWAQYLVPYRYECGEIINNKKLYCLCCEGKIAQKLESEKAFLGNLKDIFPMIVKNVHFSYRQATNIQALKIDLENSIKKLEGAEK